MLFELNTTEIESWGSDTKWNEEKEFPQDSSVMFPAVESNLPCNDTCPFKKLSQEFKDLKSLQDEMNHDIQSNYTKNQSIL